MIKPQAIYTPLYTDKEKFIILITGGRGSQRKVIQCFRLHRAADL